LDVLKFAVSQRLKTIRLKTKLSVEKFAVEIDLADSTYHNYEIGKSDTPATVLTKIVDKFNVNPYYLLSGEGNVFLNEEDFIALYNSEFEHILNEVPEINVSPEELVPLNILSIKASAGSGHLNLDIFINGKYLIQQKDIFPYNPENISILQISGDSMRPTLFDGDFVMCAIGTIGNDGVYILNVNGELRVKRLQFQLNGDVRVISDNPVYEPEFFKRDGAGDDYVKIVGRVIKRIGNI